jgi:hypothetical protein
MRTSLKLEMIQPDFAGKSQWQKWWMLITLRPRFRVLEEFVRDGQRIPAGFESDGFSIPFPLFWLLRAMAPGYELALFHDYEFIYQERLLTHYSITVTRRDANLRLKELLDKEYEIAGLGTAAYYVLRVLSYYPWKRLRKTDGR